jgi:hypothetical protein
MHWIQFVNLIVEQQQRAEAAKKRRELAQKSRPPPKPLPTYYKGPLGPNDGPNLPLPNIKTDIGQRFYPTKAQRDVAHIQNYLAMLAPAHTHAAFFKTGNVFASRISNDAETLPLRPSSNRRLQTSWSYCCKSPKACRQTPAL